MNNNIHHLKQLATIEEAREGFLDGTYYLLRNQSNEVQPEYEAYEMIDCKIVSANLEGGKEEKELYSKEELLSNELQEKLIEYISNYIDKYYNEGYENNIFKYAWEDNLIEDGVYHQYNQISKNIVTIQNGRVTEFLNEDCSGKVTVIEFYKEHPDNQETMLNYLREGIYYQKKFDSKQGGHSNEGR